MATDWFITSPTEELITPAVPTLIACNDFATGHDWCHIQNRWPFVDRVVPLSWTTAKRILQWMKFTQIHSPWLSLVCEKNQFRGTAHSMLELKHKFAQLYSDKLVSACCRQKLRISCMRCFFCEFFHNHLIQSSLLAANTRSACYFDVQRFLFFFSLLLLFAHAVTPAIFLRQHV